MRSIAGCKFRGFGGCVSKQGSRVGNQFDNSFRSQSLDEGDRACELSFFVQNKVLRPNAEPHFVAPCFITAYKTDTCDVEALSLKMSRPILCVYFTQYTVKKVHFG